MKNQKNKKQQTERNSGKIIWELEKLSSSARIKKLHLFSRSKIKRWFDYGVLKSFSGRISGSLIHYRMIKTRTKTELKHNEIQIHALCLI